MMTGILSTHVLALLFILPSQGQDISPRPLIIGNAGENVIFSCTSTIPNEAVNNALQIYNPAMDQFESFESSSRLNRTSDVGSITTYTFGPLMPSDDGKIFICSSTQRNSPNSTISLTVAEPQVPKAVNDVVATINNDDMTVDFTWEYDDSTNDIPSSNFSVRIKRNEQIILSDDISINSRSYTIPLSNLESGEMYSVEVVVRNIHGDSDPVSQIFTVPVRAAPPSSAYDVNAAIDTDVQTVTFTWKYNDGNEFLVSLNFFVSIIINGHTVFTATLPGGNRRSYMYTVPLSRLEGWQEYAVVIEAQNIYGSSELALMNFKTPRRRQKISPEQILGESGEMVTITCTAVRANEALNNDLKIYKRERETFVSFESSSRLNRISDTGVNTTYIFGPLMQNDDRTKLACFSSGYKSRNAIILVSSDL